MHGRISLGQSGKKLSKAIFWPSGGMADAADSRPVARKGVGVQVPPRPPIRGDGGMADAQR